LFVDLSNDLAGTGDPLKMAAGRIVVADVILACLDQVADACEMCHGGLLLRVISANQPYDLIAGTRHLYL